MNKVKVRLVQLGTPPVTLKNLLGWKSDFFEIVGIQKVSELPDPEDGYTYDNSMLRGLIEQGSAVDINMGVIYAPIEDNFYMHRLSDHSCVLSLHEMAEILTAVNIPLETFVIRNLYEMVLVFHEFDGSVNSSVYRVPHKDTRGCLFDFNAFKANAIWSTANVNLCASCKSRLSKKQLPDGFVEKLERELKRIKKPLTYRVLETVKKHPIWSMAISALVGLALSILGNIGYAVWLKKIFEPLPKP